MSPGQWQGEAFADGDARAAFEIEATAGLETAARVADEPLKGAAVAAVQGVALAAADVVPDVGTIANGLKLSEASKAAAKLL